MPAPLRAPLAAVFFDLAGTLADTATDLSLPVNAMRVARGLPELALADLRPFASHGARGLIGKALGIKPEDPQYEALRLDFLARYEAAMVVHTRMFDGMPQVLQTLEARGIVWGVVSNKVERYVRPIMSALGVLERAVSAVGGDTTPHAKPHPEPLLHAARLAGVDPRQCIYVGDDLRDIHAGKAAGMATVAAAYGFCGEDLPAVHWGADALIEQPLALLDHLGVH
ncbi:MAG: HAD-IA family hydrolase [Burkholderiales bacterium]